MSSDKDDISQKIVHEIKTPIYVNFNNDQSDIDSAKEPELVNPQPGEYKTYNLSSYKNYCEETNPAMSKSSSDHHTYAKY